MARELNIGMKRFTKIIVTDEPGPGGACHQYEIIPVEGERTAPYCLVKFQKGPVKENGVNGISNEDLLAIVIDRLEGFQKGEFACIENEIALHQLRSALAMLNFRTKERIKRGVEGTSQK